MLYYLLNIPMYFDMGIVCIWHCLLYIPHPTLHRLIESFITGVIVKAGYFTAHKLLPRQRASKEPKAGGGISQSAAVADYLEH